MAIALLVLRLEQATWPRAWLTVVTFPIYLLSWSILNIVVLFYRDPTWVPIPHTEALALDEPEPVPEPGAIAPEVGSEPEPVDTVTAPLFPEEVPA